jgi:hypothetical protein
MANSCISDEFPDLSFWTSTNGLELVNRSDMTYSTSEFSSARVSWSSMWLPDTQSNALQNSLSSHATSVADGSEPSNFYNGYTPHSNKIGTPEESGFGYQLPSPLEDEVLIDPATMDKEVLRLYSNVVLRRGLVTNVQLTASSRAKQSSSARI